MKRLLWTGIVTLASGLGTAIALRAVDRLWRRFAHEPPPTPPKWASFVVGRPIKKQLKHHNVPLQP